MKTIYLLTNENGTSWSGDYENTDFVYANTLTGLDTTVYQTNVFDDYNSEFAYDDDSLDWEEIKSYHA